MTPPIDNFKKVVHPRFDRRIGRSVKNRSDKSHDRFDAIDRLTAQSALTLDMMRRTLAYTGQPGALCRYRDDDPVNYETEWACIFRPASGTVEACFSHADRDPWHTFSIANGAS